MKNAYQGPRIPLIEKAQRTATVRGTLKRTNGESSAILLLDVTARASGSISAIKIYLKSPDGRRSPDTGVDIAIYSITGLTVNAKGVYAFLIAPGVAAASGWTAAPVDGVMPCEFEAEATLAGGSDMTFSLWAQLIG
ncbi:MAG: hypothetical protein WBV94_21780 [Blastocatellia bacterium]